MPPDAVPDRAGGVGRRLTRGERAAVVALLGVSTEVVFNGVHHALKRSTRTAHLRAQSYLWMVPLYGALGAGFGPARARLRGQPVVVRALAYACGFVGAEYVSGRAIERMAGVVPWDYRGRARFQVQGAARLDYAPFWAAAGLALERLDDALDGVRVGVA